MYTVDTKTGIITGRFTLSSCSVTTKKKLDFPPLGSGHLGQVGESVNPSNASNPSNPSNVDNNNNKNLTGVFNSFINYPKLKYFVHTL